MASKEGTATKVRRRRLCHLISSSTATDVTIVNKGNRVCHEKGGLLCCCGWRTATWSPCFHRVLSFCFVFTIQKIMCVMTSLDDQFDIRVLNTCIEGSKIHFDRLREMGCELTSRAQLGQVLSSFLTRHDITLMKGKEGLCLRKMTTKRAAAKEKKRARSKQTQIFSRILPRVSARKLPKFFFSGGPPNGMTPT